MSDAYLGAITATAGHVTVKITRDHYDAKCSICHMGMTCGPTFGPIPGDVMVAEWVKQHAHKAKPKRGKR